MTDDEREARVRYYLTLPWTILSELDEDGHRVLRVKEIPSAIGTGTTDAEAERDFWESLRESLRCYLDHGDPIPLPAPPPPGPFTAATGSVFTANWASPYA